MPKKIFISYSHRQGDWVWDRLVPCLKAGGVEVLIDRERFEAGKALVGQMDAAQGDAEASVLHRALRADTRRVDAARRVGLPDRLPRSLDLERWLRQRG